jgi:hypothetical protein
VGWFQVSASGDAFGLSGEVTYDRNIRAAEAIVSSAPKPMKIFPMMEVWSQAEVLALVSGASDAIGEAALATVAAGAGLSCRARSTSLS